VLRIVVRYLPLGTEITPSENRRRKVYVPNGNIIINIWKMKNSERKRYPPISENKRRRRLYVEN
jgi:hypothetical protein